MPSRYENIPGFFDFEDLYKRAVNTYPTGVFVEIGCYLGRSTCYMAELIKENKSPAKFYTVDTFLGESNAEDQKEVARAAGGTFFGRFSGHMTAAGVEEYVTAIVSDSVGASSKFEDGSVDFVFIDANHEYDFVKADLAAWYPKVKPGGLIAGHDYWQKGVELAVNEFFVSGINRHHLSWSYDKPKIL